MSIKLDDADEIRGAYLGVRDDYYSRSGWLHLPSLSPDDWIWVSITRTGKHQHLTIDYGDGVRRHLWCCTRHRLQAWWWRLKRRVRVTLTGVVWSKREAREESQHYPLQGGPDA